MSKKAINISEIGCVIKRTSFRCFAVILSCFMVFLQAMPVSAEPAPVLPPQLTLVPEPTSADIIDITQVREQMYEAAASTKGYVQAPDSMSILSALATLNAAAQAVVEYGPYSDDYKVTVQCVGEEQIGSVFFITFDYADMTITYYANELGQRVGDFFISTKPAFDAYVTSFCQSITTSFNAMTNKVLAAWYGDSDIADYGALSTLSLGLRTHVMYRMTSSYSTGRVYDTWVSGSTYATPIITLSDAYGGYLFIATSAGQCTVTSSQYFIPETGFRPVLEHAVNLDNYYKGYYWKYFITAPNLDYVPPQNVFDLSTPYARGYNGTGITTTEWVEAYIDGLPDATAAGFEIPEQPKIDFYPALPTEEVPASLPGSMVSPDVESYVDDCKDAPENDEGYKPLPETVPQEVPIPSYDPEIYPQYVPGAEISPNPDPNPDPNPNPNPDPDSDVDLDIPSAIGTLSLMDRFPFCVPHDLIAGIKLFNATPKTPTWSWNLKINGTPIDCTWTVSLEPFENVAKLCRTLLTILFVWGLAKVTRNVIKG